MIFWHVGGTVLIFRYVFRDPGVDLRFLAIGAVLPDLIDKPIAHLMGTGRSFGHSLALSLLVMALVLGLTSRGPRRQRWLVIAIGSMIHLLLDGMWSQEKVLFWPAFGWEFPSLTDDYWGGLIDRFLHSPGSLAMEAGGLAYLVYLWSKAQLADPERRHLLLREGRITV